MNAISDFRRRRLLPLLVLSCGFAGFPGSARADILTSRLTDKAAPSQAAALAGRFTSQVVYRSQEEKETAAEDADHLVRGAFGRCRRW